MDTETGTIGADNKIRTCTDYSATYTISAYSTFIMYNKLS